MKEMSDKKELLMTEKNKVLPETESTTQDDVDDSLDAYMSGLSSQLGDCSLNFIYYALQCFSVFRKFCFGRFDNQMSFCFSIVVLAIMLRYDCFYM